MVLTLTLKLIQPIFTFIHNFTYYQEIGFQFHHPGTSQPLSHQGPPCISQTYMLLKLLILL